MDKFDWFLIFIGTIIAIIFFLIGANNPIKKEIEIQRDTIIVTAIDYNIMKQNDSLCYVIDSIKTLNSKYEEELNIALFKIDRIKEYNRIAGNGNNIKYLRGWINRTLNE